MPTPKQWLLIPVLVFASLSAFSQQEVYYASQTLTFRSDLLPKSTLVSNVAPDKPGSLSPIIGSANWGEDGKNYQCRSYLRFVNMFLPRAVVEDPSLITLAELVLFPVDVSDNAADKEKSSRFVVRRVIEQWNDSATRWDNQPAADSLFMVKWSLKKKQKSKLASIDVTGMVMDMVRTENNGFLIAHDTSGKYTASRSQWFASPLYEDENRRPLLIIHYKVPVGLTSSKPMTKDEDVLIRENRMKAQLPNRDVKPEPVNTPPAGGTGQKEQ